MRLRFLKHHRSAEKNLWTIDITETQCFATFLRFPQRFRGDMDKRLRNQQLPAKFERFVNAFKKRPLVGHFVDHPERQNEIDLRIKTVIRVRNEFAADYVVHGGLPGLVFQDRQHFCLYVNGNDPAAFLLVEESEYQARWRLLSKLHSNIPLRQGRRSREDGKRIN
jgi:hypothetical protein